MFYFLLGLIIVPRETGTNEVFTKVRIVLALFRERTTCYCESFSFAARKVVVPRVTADGQQVHTDRRRRRVFKSF